MKRILMLFLGLSNCHCMTNEIEIPDGLCTFNLLLASPWREFPIILVKKFNQIKITQKKLQ